MRGGSECQQSSKKLLCTAACYLSLSLLYTKHGDASKAVTGERDNVDEQGLHFPTKPAQVLKLFRLHYLKFSTPRGPDHRSVLLLSVGRFCFRSCQPWTF